MSLVGVILIQGNASSLNVTSADTGADLEEGEGAPPSLGQVIELNQSVRLRSGASACCSESGGPPPKALLHSAWVGPAQPSERFGRSVSMVGHSHVN